MLLGYNKCCHTGIMGVAQHEYPTQSQYTHTGSTSNNLQFTWEKSLLTINSAARRIRTRDQSILSPRHYQRATDHPVCGIKWKLGTYALRWKKNFWKKVNFWVSIEWVEEGVNTLSWHIFRETGTTSKNCLDRHQGCRPSWPLNSKWDRILVFISEFIFMAN